MRKTRKKVAKGAKDWADFGKACGFSNQFIQAQKRKMKDAVSSNNVRRRSKGQR